MADFLKHALCENDNDSSPKRQKISSEESDSENSLQEIDNLDNSDCSPVKKQRATENDVGITEYISKLPGFYAVLKERYSDFIVNEIDLDGNIVKLTNMDKPSNPGVPDSNSKPLEELLEEDVILSLQELSSNNDLKEVFIKVTDKDKNVRKLIHEAIRKSFLGLDSNTQDKDGDKFIIVKKFDRNSRDRRFQSVPGKNYLHFILYKENRDTMNTINTISSILRVQPKIFSYAGTKDKRAKTSQVVSVHKMSPEKLLSINKKFNQIKVGNIRYENEPINLGDLSGNKFVLVLRQLNGEPEIIEKAVNSLAINGFINYYGMQRFGSSSISTHSIGKALLLSDWKNAINLILKPRLEGDKDLAKSREIWIETNDAEKAYENLRNKSSIEGKLFYGLASSNENDYVNALNAIPRNTRLMYIHSYQSYIWNKVLSERIKKFGFKVLVGDLIYKTNDEPDKLNPEPRKRIKKIALKTEFVTEDNIKNVSINDILLPLPGYSVTYPKNETKQYYESILEDEGMNLGSFESNVKTYSLSGDYRKVIVIPTDVHWEILPYEDVKKPLVLSDLDVLKGESLEVETSGSLKALKLELKLPSSSYATMALREILKIDTTFIRDL